MHTSKLRRYFLAVIVIILTGFATMNDLQSGHTTNTPESVNFHESQREFQLPELIQTDNDGFIIVAHRGAKAKYPENTIPAVKAAWEMGAEMVEVDVRLSKDGVPVVIHDARLNRTTNGKGLVSHHTVEQLKMLDAGSWFSNKFWDVQIPTLEEVLEFSRDKVALNIEIKTSSAASHQHRNIEEKCLRLVKKYNMERHVLFSSFDYRVIKNLRKQDNDVSLALLYSWKSSGDQLPSQLTKKYQTDAFNCARSDLNQRWFQDLQKNDIPLFVYTVNRKHYMKKLLKTPSVKGIITNRPGRLKSVVNTFRKSAE